MNNSNTKNKHSIKKSQKREEKIIFMSDSRKKENNIHKFQENHELKNVSTI